MKISLVSGSHERKKFDFLIVPYWEGGKGASRFTHPGIESLLASGDFQGKVGETALLYLDGERFLLLGLGKKGAETAESLRRSYASAIKIIFGKKGKSCHLIFPEAEAVSFQEALIGVCDGVFLTNYAFDRWKAESAVLLEQLEFSGVDRKMGKEIERQQTIASAVHFIRDLVNENADVVTPSRLAHEAMGLGNGVKTAVFDAKQLELEGMGLLLAVGQGAVDPPCLIISSYQGNPTSDQKIVLIGKGITFDTGGLSLKASDNMLTMKCDMAGAATVLAVVKAAAELKLKVNITALAPTAENAIGSHSYKLGDVYRACNGKTVEILNTDAEGRLVLADAIAYAVKHLHPSYIVDVGTLTGAALIALGEEIAALYANDEKLAKSLEAASTKTGEEIWRMPLHDYKESLHSEIADLANMGGKDAGSMKCALFLQEFTGNVPWAHIDMAGPAYLSKPKHYAVTRGTGWGLRLLLDFLERL